MAERLTAPGPTANKVSPSAHSALEGPVSQVHRPRTAKSLEGGLPIMIDGFCVGAIGVGSGTGAQDVEVARAALAAIGAEDQKP